MLLTTIALIAITLYAGWRQMRPTTLNSAADLYKLPAILVGVGLLYVHSWMPRNAVEGAVLTLSLVLAVAVGVARGRLARVWQDQNGIWQTQGTKATLTLWALLIAAKCAIGFTTAALGMTHASGPDLGEVLTFIGISLAASAAVIARRTLRTTAHAHSAA
ncbi:hypothetical protein ACIQWN_32375 [Streptomyces vinaceus]|uniref:hypothetical protein n=1 Tax=Streptomyces vinaceus TaxID=1960 RepID=UPI00380B938F